MQLLFHILCVCLTLHLGNALFRTLRLRKWALTENKPRQTENESSTPIIHEDSFLYNMWQDSIHEKSFTEPTENKSRIPPATLEDDYLLFSVWQGLIRGEP